MEVKTRNFEASAVYQKYQAKPKGSKYTPHQGEQEKARRQRQAEKIKAKRAA